MLGATMQLLLRTWSFVLLAVLVPGCASAPPLPPPAPESAPAPVPESEQRERDLAAAQAAYVRDPRDEMAAVWLGRRLGYVGRYEAAVAAFTRGLEVHPDSAWLYRFRGHRYITLRRFDDAARDLERARDLAASRPDEVEPDGAPNKAGVPIGTLRSNIDYHLGLAQFLRGDFAAAWRAYESGFALARANDDRLGVAHVLVVADAPEAGPHGRGAATARADPGGHADPRERELPGALALLPRRHRRGRLFAAPASGKNDFATRGFGAAMKHVFDGDVAGAAELLERVVKNGPASSFGCIAAEVELRRLPTAR
jgi:tetratricopeptide (TPR) repeat protein